MKRNSIYHIILVTIAFVCICTVSSAQSLHSGYFLEGYTYRHLMNPAFAPERNYVAFRSSVILMWELNRMLA